MIALTRPGVIALLMMRMLLTPLGTPQAGVEFNRIKHRPAAVR
jgi:hypothetical protein